MDENFTANESENKTEWVIGLLGCLVVGLFDYWVVGFGIVNILV